MEKKSDTYDLDCQDCSGGDPDGTYTIVIGDLPTASSLVASNNKSSTYSINNYAPNFIHPFSTSKHPNSCNKAGCNTHNW